MMYIMPVQSWPKMQCSQMNDQNANSQADCDGQCERERKRGKGRERERWGKGRVQKSDGDESDRDWGVYNKVDKKKRETLHPITKGTESFAR